MQIGDCEVTDRTGHRTVIRFTVATGSDTLNACYVDIDFHKLGLDIGTVIGRVVNLQESGQLPHASMIVRSGHGIWLLWLVHDIEDKDTSQPAFPDRLELYRPDSSPRSSSACYRLALIWRRVTQRATCGFRVLSILDQRAMSSGGFRVPTTPVMSTHCLN